MAFVRWNQSIAQSFSTNLVNPSINPFNTFSVNSPFVANSAASSNLNAINSSPEVVWRNYLTGEMRSWQVQNGQVTNVQNLPTVADFGWQLDAVVDVDLDGDRDFLWRDQRSGAVGIWQMQMGQIQQSHMLQLSGTPSFTIVAVADFTQDNQADLLSFNYQTGETQIWQMSGFNLLQKISLPTVTDTNWRIQGIGDFNNDQQIDILWQHFGNGALSVWMINQGQILGIQNLPTMSNLNWRLEGLEDADRDGDLDVLWRDRSSGDVTIWQMQDLNVQQSFVVGLVKEYGLNIDWRLEQIADFDQDGDFDVLWYNPGTGGTGLWQLDQARLQASLPLKRELQAGWTIEEVAA